MKIEKVVENLKSNLTIKRPLALQWHEWNEWHEKMQNDRPFAYWLNETVPDFFDDIWRTITNPFNDLRYWIRYRIFDKYHIINTGLKPGYYDCYTLLLHGMFNLLVDFVEIERAWMNVVFDEDARKKYKYPLFTTGWLRFRSFRCKEAGLEHLDWEYSLGNPNLDESERCESQAANAAEILELYKWWKEVRPNRPDPLDASGWSNWCDYKEAKGYKMFTDSQLTEEEEAEQRRILHLSTKIETDQFNEDTEMLTRLIKIRGSLWT